MVVPTNPQYPTVIDGDEFFGGDVINQAQFTLSARLYNRLCI